MQLRDKEDADSKVETESDMRRRCMRQSCGSHGQTLRQAVSGSRNTTTLRERPAGL